jgi:sigma-54 dependent transcriptional regulator, acetoin dehydrogenase operon transcriptional activator AcoR
MSSATTTAPLEDLSPLDATVDTTPGLALVFALDHVGLPAALPFSRPLVTLGREPQSTLPLRGPAISRQHASFERRNDGRVWVVDSLSLNGTFVNGQRVSEQPLAEHDLLGIGETLFRFVGRNVRAHEAYRIDGEVLHERRPFRHGIESAQLAGGYQIDALLDLIARIAPSELAVVIHGETGTGKERVAQELHRQSKRKGRFQAVNCAALPETLIESELFGYRRGAFSGAHTDKPGLIRAAHGGTLFLDEIGDMPIGAQAKLLRVLQEKELVPIGATSPERVDLRVVCATHHNLPELVQRGLFRADLLGRLHQFSISLPPLRHRREDLYRLVCYFLGQLEQPAPPVSFAFMHALALHHWPYNVRELQGAVHVARTMSEGGPLEYWHLPQALRSAVEQHASESLVPFDNRRSSLPAEPPTAREPTRRRRGTSPTPRAEELQSLLKRFNGNVSSVAKELGKHRMQVHRWLQLWNIAPDDYRPS